jgi:hypothetical protein
VPEVKCPSCGSARVQKSSAIYEQGISHSQGKSSGIGISSRGRVGVYSGGSKSTRISQLAEQNAPPENSVVGCAFAVPFAGFLLLAVFSDIGFLTGVFIGAAVGVGAALWMHNLTKNEYAEELAKYNARWYCRKCGNYFHIK